MNIKIIYHIMPWEIDYALLSFMQLKKSKYFLPKDVTISIATVLNLSTHIINWEDSKLPKEYFINKYNQISNLLVDYKHTKNIYDGDSLYGHLDFQKECIHPDNDYYIVLCPDMYFSEHLLAYMIEGARSIKNKYFVLTPQICRMWDESWEILTHPKFAVGPHYGWEKTTDIFDVDYHLHNSSEDVQIKPIDQLKWAGWFDLYSKDFYENLAQIPDQWSGYGAWDYYGIVVSSIAKQKGYDFQQYLLSGQIVFEYGIGPLQTDSVSGFSNYYKSLIVRKDVSEQRDSFNQKLEYYIQKRIQGL